jgi:hypothetical protein
MSSVPQGDVASDVISVPYDRQAMFPHLCAENSYLIYLLRTSIISV